MSIALAPKTITLPPPMPHQIPMLLASSRFKVLACGRRWGKSVLGLIATLAGHGPYVERDGKRVRQFRGAIDGGNIWWVAPDYPTAELIWRMLKRATRDAWVDKDEQGRSILLPTNGRVTVKSAESSLRGDGLDGVVGDEWAFLPRAETWKEDLRPALSDKQGWALFISSPNGFNHFKDLYDAAEHLADWQRWQRPTGDNTMIPPEELAKAAAETTPRGFAQEYGAQFISMAGAMFSRDWIRRYTRLPSNLGLVAGLDMAATKAELVPTKTKREPDRTALVVLGVERQPNGSTQCYVVDVQAGWWDVEQRRAMVDESYHTHKWDGIDVEANAFAMDTVQMWKRTAPYQIRPTIAKDPKVVRAQPLATAMSNGEVWLPAVDTPPWRAWGQLYEKELFEFPMVAHDDQVDATVWAYSRAQVWQPRQPGISGGSVSSYVSMVRGR